MKKITLLSSIAAAVILTGCGGGGSSSSSESTLSIEDATISAKAIDGYLAYSTVCLDLNQNGVCDKELEPIATTNEKGEANLTITAKHQQDPNFSKASLLVYGGIDTDTKKDFLGNLKSPVDLDENSLNITPATTLVAKMVEKGTPKEDAQKQVAKILGLKDPKLVEEDPIELANKSNDTTLLKSVLKLQKSLELLASTQEDPKAALTQLYNALSEAISKVNDLLQALEKIPETAPKTLKVEKKDLESAKFVTIQISAINNVTSAKELAFKANKTKDVVEEEVLKGNKSLDEVKNEIKEITSRDFSQLYAEDLLRNIGYKDSDFEDMVKKVAAALKAAGIETKDNFTTDDELKALKDAKLTKVVALYEKYLALKETQAKANSSDGIALKLPFVMYDLDIDRDEYDEIEEIIINTPKISGYQYEYNLSTNKWDKHSWNEHEDDDFILIDGKWQKDPLKLEKISDSEFVYDGYSHFKIIKEIDLTKDTSLMPPKFKNMKFSSGAKAYLASFKNVKDNYEIWDKVRTHGNTSGEYYTSLEDFIKYQSKDRWFMGDHDGGLAFEKPVDGKLKVGDSGNLVKVQEIRLENGDSQTKIVGKGGTWKVIKLPTGDLALIIKSFESKHDDNLFVLKDGIVWRGEYEKATNEWRIDDELNFNKIATEDIKKYILANFKDELIKQVSHEDEHEDENQLKEISNPLSSIYISFLDEDGTTLDVPNDAWVRILPKEYINQNKWDYGLVCKVEVGGNLAGICYTRGDEEELTSITSNPDTVYDVVIFKNNIEPDEKNWDCKEDVYKFTSGKLSDLSTITVTPSDYVDNSQAECGD
jgi:hypothetical protein